MTILEFNQDGDTLIGIESISPTYSLYLGRSSHHLPRRSDALAEFNLPNARAPEDWPMLHGELEGRCQRFNDRELSFSARGELRPSDVGSEDPLGS